MDSSNDTTSDRTIVQLSNWTLENDGPDGQEKSVLIIQTITPSKYDIALQSAHIIQNPGATPEQIDLRLIWIDANGNEQTHRLFGAAITIEATSARIASVHGNGLRASGTKMFVA
jgi:uncharacterized protein YcfL